MPRQSLRILLALFAILLAASSPAGIATASPDALSSPALLASKAAREQKKEQKKSLAEWEKHAKTCTAKGTQPCPTVSVTWTENDAAPSSLCDAVVTVTGFLPGRHPGEAGGWTFEIEVGQDGTGSISSGSAGHPFGTGTRLTATVRGVTSALSVPC